MPPLSKRTRRCGLGMVLALACADPTAAPDPGGSSSTTGEAATSSASADTTTAADPCGGCEAWQSCVEGACVPRPGHCAVDDDCAPGQLCAESHACAAACELLTCPVHASCVAELAACVCDDGFFANAGACVERILLALPMDNPDDTLIAEVVGFDNDLAPGDNAIDCRAYDGEAFPRCYDGHSGTDFMLAGGFTTMDAGSAAVFAAADGEVVFVHDGEYDRCALDLQAQAVLCEDGGPVTPANEITVLHADGLTTRYLHLKKDSIVVAEGEQVTCGQPMALVGSSGNSSAPHLHLEVLDVEGSPVDPFAGPYSQPESYWAVQDGAYGLPGAACQ